MCHGVELGQTYATKDSAKTFTHFISESQCSGFLQSLSTAHFYSFLLDGSTDAGKIEDEVLIMTFCKDDSTDLLLDISVLRSLKRSIQMA